MPDRVQIQAMGTLVGSEPRGLSGHPAAALVRAVRRARVRPTSDRIHELRIAVRRLEASFGLADPTTSPSLATDEVTRFARIAGELRDLDITDEWLAAAYHPAPPPSRPAERLRRARRRQETPVVRRLSNLRSERALARLRQEPGVSLDGAARLSLDQLSAALLGHAAWRLPVPASIEAAVADPSTIEPHHDLRRALRLYRHAARLSHPGGSARPDFGAAQAALARLHDLTTIAGRLMPLAGGPDQLPARLTEALAVDWRRARRGWREIALETVPARGSA